MRSAALRLTALILLLSPLLAAAQEGTPATNVPTPESVIGFELGTDGRLASWGALVDYYEVLGESSDRVTVRNLGESTLGNPFPLVLISSPENLARAERLAEISRQLADPRGLSSEEVEALVSEGRAVVAVTAGLHSTEVAAAQMAPSLAYRLASSDDAEVQRVLDNVVFLLFPSFNPDGTDMVVEWVDETRGTEWEGARMPDLYHTYTGHDNNRDAYMLTQNESRMFADVVYHEWVPQLFLDVHQMGSYGARLYIPPYDDPINPNVDPLVWMEHELIGANMEIALEREGIDGVVTGAPYTGWWFPSFHMVTNHHNIAGMLTESASARMAWPLRIHPHQLAPNGRGHKMYAPMQAFPHPWEGGWWRVADIIRQQHVSTYALLTTAADNRELFLRNMVFKARRTVERGESEAPFAYVIRADQHDPLTVQKLVATLMRNGIEVHRATADFVQDGQAFAAGDFVVSRAQPNGVLVKSLLDESRYPDDATTRRDDGAVVEPYDMATFVLAHHMGVHVVPTQTPVEAALEPLTSPPESPGNVAGNGGAGWLASHATNDAFRATNRILANGGQVYWLQEEVERGEQRYGYGALWVPSDGIGAEELGNVARETGVDFQAVAEAPAGPALHIQPLRLALYRRYLGGNMDEGWTRYIFDNWDVPYERMEAQGIRDDGLEDFDVLLIPDDDLDALRGETDERATGEGESEEYPDIFLPPQYRDGLDDDAIDNIRAWVRAGGTLVLMNEAAELATEEFGVPVRNVVEELPDSAFFSPGSLLRARFDRSHPLAYGMPPEAWILNWDSPTFEVERTEFNGRIASPVTYAERDLLKSGWLLGEDKIAKRPAALDIAYGAGRIILIGFRAQHRAQTHGTFKVFFNALHYGAAEPVRLGEVAAEVTRP